MPGLGLALVCIRLNANDLFVAPDGSPLGAGTLSAPYDLITTLSGQVGQPGDTFWLRGGDYKLGHLNTTIQGAPGLPVTFREVAGEHARIDGSITVFNSIGYVVFRDFELHSSVTNRVSAQAGMGFNVTDISILPGIACYAPNVSCINLVIHDQTRHGIYCDETSTNALVYGCIVFNNGWVSPDNAEGHGIYVQGTMGSKTVADNIVFNNSGVGMHIYENAPGENLVGVTLDGNVAFNAGTIQLVRGYRDWLVGVDAPATYADGITLESNMGYEAPGQSILRGMQVGRDSTNGTVVLRDNYMHLGLLMNNWSNATVTGNQFTSVATNYAVDLGQTLTSLSANWDRNIYICASQDNEILLDAAPVHFSDWQSATGFDANSTCVIGNLSGTRVFVRPNLYENGRANIIVYNWNNLDNVSVDVGSVLAVGSGFEVRNAQDFYAPPVLSGVFDGQRLQLPMTNLTVAVPNGPVSPTGPLFMPPPTGPTFNVFVLLPSPGGLQIKPSNGSIQVSWPTNLIANVLQYSDTLTAANGWTDSTNAPVVEGDEYTITEPTSSHARFYRLRVGP